MQSEDYRYASGVNNSVFDKCMAKLKSLLQERLLAQKLRLLQYWQRNRNKWPWLLEKPVSNSHLSRRLALASVPSFGFYFLLFLSSVISTLGLLADSVAVIIGAMIIAPLMRPIITTAYAIVVANQKLLRRSILTILISTILAIATSFFTAYVLGLKSTNPEIIARANPSLIDLGIAIAAGTAGAFANSRRHIADALPGVAISVALVPPLSVIGIGMSLGRGDVTTGALVLFLTNLIGIIFSGSLVFLLQRYGSLEKAKHGLSISLVILTLLLLPLGLSLEKLLVKESARRSIEVLIRRQTVTFSRTDIRSLRVSPQGNAWFVEMEVAAPLGSISQYQVELVQKFLTAELDKAVNLEVRVIPIDVLEASNSNGSSTLAK